MPQIILNVSDEQLAQMVKGLKEYEPEYKVLDPVKLLTLLLKQEVEDAEVYLLDRLDNGGNSLIGDVLGEEECVGVVEDTRN